VAPLRLLGNPDRSRLQDEHRVALLVLTKEHLAHLARAAESLKELVLNACQAGVEAYRAGWWCVKNS